VAPALLEKGKTVFTPPVGGTITLTFSNSHSYFRSKTVHLRVLPGLGPLEASIREKSPYVLRAAGGAVPCGCCHAA
jgi:hypothetical protein